MGANLDILYQLYLDAYRLSSIVLIELAVNFVLLSNMTLRQIADLCDRLLLPAMPLVKVILVILMLKSQSG
jgi:hypothetical protein